MALLCFWVSIWMLNCGYILQCTSFCKKTLMRWAKFFICLHSVQSTSEDKRNKTLFIQKSKQWKTAVCFCIKRQLGLLQLITFDIKYHVWHKADTNITEASLNKAKAAAFQSMISTIFLLSKLEDMFSIIAKYSKTRILCSWKVDFCFQKKLHQLTNCKILVIDYVTLFSRPG